MQPPANLAIDAETDRGPVGQVDGIAERLTVHLPGTDRVQAQQVVDMVQQVGLCSDATRCHIEVGVSLA